MLGSHQARLVLIEGKYHQVKRMFAAIGHHVTGLHRSSIGPIELDAALAPGEWRHLSKEEIAAF
jgi:16S rRNA pseudouridine516 synthase